MKINLECLPENYSQSFYLELYYRFPKTFIVATISNRVVGYIMCRVELGFSEIHRFNIIRKGHVVSIAILPEYRRKNIGKALVTDALNGMKEYNLKEGYLEVRTSNEPAIFLYKKLEFRIVRKLDNYYKDGEDAYVMVQEVKY